MTFDSFDVLFQAAEGVPPFPYQQDLANNDWPDLLTVPTGAGKTAAAVLTWLWRRRYAPPDVRARTPRRLVYCLPMRTLVEQTERNARGWLERLGLTDAVGVHVLQGGSVDNGWDAAPERDAILIGTQDQLLSRALLRGYAMSRYRWPVHFALLHNDAQWVFDETQLMGVGLSTAAQLDGLRRSLGTGAPSRSLWMSATNAPERLGTIDLRAHPLKARGLTDRDTASPELHKRLIARKPVARLDVPGSAKVRTADVAAAVLARHTPGTLTVVVLNQVARAQAVFQALQKKAGAEPVLLVHSRFRPVDRAQRTEALTGHPTGIVVATQAIEAGVDLSARLLVTELAPWDSLVQRAGRCNRRGEFTAEQAAVLWLDIEEADALPYTTQALDHARSLLTSLDDIGPETLKGVSVPASRPAAPVLRRKDLLELFDTEPDLTGLDIDISLWVRDSETLDVQLAWRALGDAPPPASSPRLQRDELCRVPFAAALKHLQGSTAWQWDVLEGTWLRAPKLAPGGAYLVDVGVGGYDEALGYTGKPADHPAPVEVDATVGAAPSDASDRLTTEHGAFQTLRQHATEVHDELRDLLAGLGHDAPTEILLTAARWHDLGKVHPAFQAMLMAALPEDDPRRDGGPWAKSDGKRAATLPAEHRRHFRHEWASALSWLAQGGDDLVAYLIAAHHGKVRLRARPRPGEQPDQATGELVCLGVAHGDELPGADLGDGVLAPPQTLTLDLLRLGGTELGASWLERTLDLLQTHGPFRLAWWEALVRIADWRASARARTATTEVLDD
jgi:CRISPR-associated endonuclease/helicase Cas3